MQGFKITRAEVWTDHVNGDRSFRQEQVLEAGPFASVGAAATSLGWTIPQVRDAYDRGELVGYRTEGGHRRVLPVPIPLLGNPSKP
jgi:hypothetical protein